ncbi:hypothetical protein [Pleionea sp. CnH1-48]|uniref:hypothetical protein n=1 Tax=Pleionea sp. CnH1-48 TaxID=2954494 RepID=UPI00209772B8|nr:hypothetical protein [Pleionea sp. CnH1-48]MCO7222896.1 hypothetical protein [Pleionea sp. CnH1-48]
MNIDSPTLSPQITSIGNGLDNPPLLDLSGKTSHPSSHPGTQESSLLIPSSNLSSFSSIKLDTNSGKTTKQERAMSPTLPQRMRADIKKAAILETALAELKKKKPLSKKTSQLLDEVGTFSKDTSTREARILLKKEIKTQLAETRNEIGKSINKQLKSAGPVWAIRQALATPVASGELYSKEKTELLNVTNELAKRAISGLEKRNPLSGYAPEVIVTMATKTQESCVLGIQTLERNTSIASDEDLRTEIIQTIPKRSYSGENKGFGDFMSGIYGYIGTAQCFSDDSSGFILAQGKLIHVAPENSSDDLMPDRDGFWQHCTGTGSSSKHLKMRQNVNGISKEMMQLSCVGKQTSDTVRKVLTSKLHAPESTAATWAKTQIDGTDLRGSVGLFLNKKNAAKSSDINPFDDKNTMVMIKSLKAKGVKSVVLLGDSPQKAAPKLVKALLSNGINVVNLTEHWRANTSSENPYTFQSNLGQELKDQGMSGIIGMRSGGMRIFNLGGDLPIIPLDTHPTHDRFPFEACTNQSVVPLCVDVKRGLDIVSLGDSIDRMQHIRDIDYQSSSSVTSTSSGKPKVGDTITLTDGGIAKILDVHSKGYVIKVTQPGNGFSNEIYQMNKHQGHIKFSEVKSASIQPMSSGKIKPGDIVTLKDGGKVQVIEVGNGFLVVEAKTKGKGIQADIYLANSKHQGHVQPHELQSNTGSSSNTSVVSEDDHKQQYD